MTTQPPEKEVITSEAQLLFRALMCLRLEVPASIADDIRDKAEAALVVERQAREAAQSLLADRSTELDWERSARQAAEKEVERLQGLVTASEQERYRVCGELLGKVEAAEAERDKLAGEVAQWRGAAGDTQERLEAAEAKLAALPAAVSECRDAVEFFDRVKSATEDERIAVGSDHWNRLESAARRVALSALPPPVPTEEGGELKTSGWPDTRGPNWECPSCAESVCDHEPNCPHQIAVAAALQEEADDTLLSPAHQDTHRLLNRFSLALADKLARAEIKYGYGNGWLTDDWEAECRVQLHQHADKGDPLDVAAYAAFCWAHRWSTSLPTQSQDVAGLVEVPRRPTREMLNAAIDVDSFKLGDISPLGFRMSPQMLFEKCWTAMVDAALLRTSPTREVEGFVEAAADNNHKALVEGSK